MEPATAMEEVLPGVWRWEQYSAAHKVALTSHAVLHAGKILVFDPIPLVPAELRSMDLRGRLTGIVATNANHERDAWFWAERFHVPVWAASTAGWSRAEALDWTVPGGDWQGWTMDDLPGGAEGETSFRLDAGSLVICGDALVNLPGRGLEVLPARYCRDRELLKQGLRGLVKRPFERLLVAHGEPVLTAASERVAALL